MRTRLKDIASELNISAGLVSGVLNGRHNVWASEETRKRIFDVAKRLNYNSTTPIKATAHPSPERMELVLCRSGHETLSESTVVWEALRLGPVGAKANWVVLSFGDLQNAIDHLTAGSRTAPVVLAGSDSDVEEMARTLESRSVPFLILGSKVGPDASWPRWYPAFEDMITGAIDHVRVQGHRRIAYLGSNVDSAPQRLMRECFVKWVSSVLAGSNCADLVVACPAGFEENRALIERLLDRPENERPTGFVVSGGLGVWQALELCLNKRGQRLGFTNGMPSASGLFDHSVRLLFGDALGFDLADQTASLSSVLDRMCDSTKGSRTLDNSYRNAPRLSRIPSLHLDLTADLRNPREEPH